MHIPRSQRGQKGTVIILINGLALAGPLGYRRILRSSSAAVARGPPSRWMGRSVASSAFIYLWDLPRGAKEEGVLMGLREISSVLMEGNRCAAAARFYSPLRFINPKMDARRKKPTHKCTAARHHCCLQRVVRLVHVPEKPLKWVGLEPCAQEGPS